MRFSETDSTTAASQRCPIARCFKVAATVVALSLAIFSPQSQAAVFNSNDVPGGYGSLTGTTSATVLNVDGSGVDVELQAQSFDKLHSTSGVLISGALEPFVQELGIDSSDRSVDSSPNQINSLPVFPAEGLGFFFSSPVTITSLTLSRLNGDDSFTLTAYDSSHTAFSTVTFGGAGSWSGPFSSISAVTGSDSSTGW